MCVLVTLAYFGCHIMLGNHVKPHAVQTAWVQSAFVREAAEKNAATLNVTEHFKGIQYLALLPDISPMNILKHSFPPLMR